MEIGNCVKCGSRLKNNGQCGCGARQPRGNGSSTGQDIDKCDYRDGGRCCQFPGTVSLGGGWTCSEHFSAQRKNDHKLCEEILARSLRNPRRPQDSAPKYKHWFDECLAAFNANLRSANPIPPKKWPKVPGFAGPVDNYQVPASIANRVKEIDARRAAQGLPPIGEEYNPIKQVNDHISLGYLGINSDMPVKDNSKAIEDDDLGW